MTRPALRVVRDSAPPPRLELPSAAPWYDRPWFGAVIVAAMFIGIGLVAIAVGWVR